MTPEDFGRFDLLVCMDEENRRQVRDARRRARPRDPGPPAALTPQQVREDCLQLRAFLIGRYSYLKRRPDVAKEVLAALEKPVARDHAGLALFLSLFVMAPTLSVVNDEALQPYLDGTISQEEAVDRASEPIRDFMLVHTEESELEVMLEASGQGRPQTADDIGLSALIPAFLLSEMKTAFIIGFVVFMPFLVIDLVVSSVLMSLGMMMLPPVFVSLPFKILLFVMVNGWTLVAETLITSFNTS